jgi:hypothetical protein
VGAKRRLPTDKHLDGDMIQASKNLSEVCYSERPWQVQRSAGRSRCRTLFKGVVMLHKTMIALAAVAALGTVAHSAADACGVWWLP